MSNLNLGLLIESIGALGCFSIPIIFLMTGKKRYLILSIISLTMLISGFMITLL